MYYIGLPKHEKSSTNSNRIFGFDKPYSSDLAQPDLMVLLCAAIFFLCHLLPDPDSSNHCSVQGELLFFQESEIIVLEPKSIHVYPEVPN